MRRGCRGRDRMVVEFYNYLYNRCLSPLKLWVWILLMARCTRYNIMWSSLSVNCDRSLSFSGYSSFLHQWNWPPRYNWNIFESGDKLHKPKPSVHELCQMRLYFSSCWLLAVRKQMDFLITTLIVDNHVDQYY